MNGYPVGYFFRVRHKNDSDKWAFLSTPIYDENVVAAQARLALTYTPDKFVLTPDGTTLTSGVTVERALEDGRRPCKARRAKKRGKR